MWSRLSSDRFSAISDRCPSRTTLSAVMTVKPTAAPRSRAPQVAGEGEDRPRAERQRVAPAAARVGVDEVGRRPGELVRHPLLDPRERRQQRLLHPPQPHQAEQPDEPRPGDQREAEHRVPFRRIGCTGSGAAAGASATGSGTTGFASFPTIAPPPGARAQSVGPALVKSPRPQGTALARRKGRSRRPCPGPQQDTPRTNGYAFNCRCRCARRRRRPAATNPAPRASTPNTGSAGVGIIGV